MSNRIVRINELVQREISDILRRRHAAEAVAITISEVRIAPDLRDGRVFVAIVGSEEQVAERFRWLKGKSAEIREELARRIVIKFLPRFTYVLDRSAERASSLLRTMDEIGLAGSQRSRRAMDKYYPEFERPFASLLEAVAGRPVAVIGHARPDGDCVGSQVALSRVLSERGARVTCVNPDPVPRRLAFLARQTPFIRTDEALALAPETLAVFVDCADHARAGERLKARFPRPAASIDHHLSNGGFAQINIVDSGSAAACEMLAGILIDARLRIDSVSATALFAGILTDTGQFRYNSTSRRSFALAGELVDRGASPSEAGYELYERESVGKLRLLQGFLATLRMECGGRVCLGTLPAGIFEDTATTAEDTEGLVDYARCIDGVDVGVLIEEKPDGGFKASLRAKDPVCRLDLVAGLFGGGGHACAAGLNQKSGLPGFREKLVAALGERLKVVDLERARAGGGPRP